MSGNDRTVRTRPPRPPRRSRATSSPSTPCSPPGELPLHAGQVPAWSDEDFWLTEEKAGRWADGSHTADTVYNRRHGVGTRDPLNAIPLYGGPAHAAVAHAREPQGSTDETSG